MAVNRSALVGGFVLGAVILIVVAILLFGGRSLFANKSRAVVFFQGSVAGLQIGAPVTFRGMRVGSVRSISLQINSDELTATVPVFIELEEDGVTMSSNADADMPVDIEKLVEAGLRAQLTAQSLVTGQFAVELDMKPNTQAYLDGTDMGAPEIPTLPSEFQNIKEQFSDLPLRSLAERAVRTLESLEVLSTNLNKEIGPSASSLRATSDAARQAVIMANEAVSVLQTDVSRTLKNIDRLIATGQMQLDKSGPALDQTLESANRAIGQAETLMSSVNSLTDPRSQMRADLEAAIRDLAASASSLRGFASEIERNPGAILTGRGGR
ncbi:MlaD family protein [Thalassospira alkalitolerans]|uniref:MlaD family protein n=1 Tax=Thalassospira alkalitolerans TaxID=1293890 RepID=UPI0030EE5091|tara:strand:+ start:98251 stop:99225 length:975 start_codon:yes stop_codon:yes gene_type:complete